MNGRDFLNAARRLAAGPEEPDWRSGVSRAYYATFHAARDRLAALRFRVPHADRAHNYLYVRLNNCGNASAKDAASRLNDLRFRRNYADYNMRSAVSSDDVNDAVADAERILQLLDALTPAELTAMTAAIKLYEQAIGDVTWQP